MSTKGLLSRLKALCGGRRMEDELSEELRFHLQNEVEKNIAAGMTPEQARDAALRSFGGVDQAKEQCRDARGIRLFEELWQDIRYGIRMFAKDPGLAVVAVLTLALGIGVNTAIFSTVNGVLLRPFSFQQPDRLLSVWCTDFSRGVPQMGCAEPDLQEIARRNHSFESLAGYYWKDVNLTDGQPERMQALLVSPGLFPLLGVTSAMGRTFSEDEGLFGKHRVAVLSHRMWERRFGRRNVLGETFHLDSEWVTVVGVMPPDFEFPNESVDLWMPIAFGPNDAMGTRNNHFIKAVARLKSGVETPQARVEVQAIAHDLEKQFSENAGLGADASDYLTSVVGDVKSPLLIMLAAVTLVLLIACVNVANLLLSKASARHRELSVRAALGASQGRLVRQLASESLLLGAIGAGLGLFVGSLLLQIIKTLAPSDIPRLHGVEIDFQVLLFTAGLSILSALFFGLAPILALSRMSLNESLKEGGRSATTSPQASRARNVLVVLEVVLSLILSIGAGLLVRTLQRLYAINPGFQAKNVLTMAVTLPESKYQEPAKAALFYRDLVQRLQAIPGVKLAAAGTTVPLAGGGWGKYFTVDEHPSARLADVPGIQYRQVTPDYFWALGISLRSGRNFTEGDVAEKPLVAIINEAAARRFFPNQNPIGKRVLPFPPEQTIAALLPSPDYRFPRLTLVGVVGDVKQRGLNLPSEPELFVPHLQGMAKGNEEPSRSMGLVIKTTSDPLSFANAVHRAVLSLDPEQPVSDVKSMEQRLDASLAQQRFQLILLGAFAALAIVLAAIGIYGVMSYLAEQRTHEIGIRMALGAGQRDVMNLIVRQGMALSLVGVGFGIVSALALTRFLTRLLFDVRPADPMTFVSVSLLLIAVSLLACYIPARRATRIDPMAALKCD